MNCVDQPEPGLQGVDGQTRYMAGMPCQDWRRNPQPVESLGDEPIRRGDADTAGKMPGERIQSGKT